MNPAERYAKRATRKARRKSNAKFIQTMTGIQPYLSHAVLEKARWDMFSLLIRMRDRGLGCFSCLVGPIQCAGHVISRQRLATKYHESNVHGQCNTCNFKDKNMAGFHDQCVVMAIRKIGAEKYVELVELSKTTIDESKGDIIQMTADFKARLESGRLK